MGQANTFKLSLLGLLLQEMDIGCLLVDLSFKHIGYLFDLILVVMDELLLLELVPFEDGLYLRLVIFTNFD